MFHNAVTINIQGTGCVDVPCFTCVGAWVGRGALQDLAKLLPTHRVDPAVLPWLQLSPVLIDRSKTVTVFFLFSHTKASKDVPFNSDPNPNQQQVKHCRVCFTFNHLTSTFCLENSHSRVAGNSSSKRTSVSGFRMDTGVSVGSVSPIFQTANNTNNNTISHFFMDVWRHICHKAMTHLSVVRLRTLALQYG